MESEPTDQRKALEEAFRAIWPMPNREDEPEWQGPGTLREPLYHHWKVREVRFTAMLDAEAWLSAAEMLVPEGFMWEIGVYNNEDGFSSGIYARVSKYCGGDGPRFEFDDRGEGTTPALALLSAILAARGQNDE